MGWEECGGEMESTVFEQQYKKGRKEGRKEGKRKTASATKTTLKIIRLHS